jgi:hypothetical protein
MPSADSAPEALAEPERLQEERYSPFVRVTVRRWVKWYLDGTETF